MRTLFTLGWEPASNWMGQEAPTPRQLTKQERDTILKMIEEGKARLYAVAAWHADRIPTFRMILGPEKTDKYSQALTEAMARQQTVDALQARLGSDTPGAWLLSGQESEAQLQWSAAAQKLYELVKPYMSTPAVEPEKPKTGKPSTKEIVAVGGVVVGVAIMVAVVA